MKYFVKFSCVTLNFLVLANIVSSTVYIVPKYDDTTLGTKKYDFKQSLVLSCNVTSDDNKKAEVVWEKDGKLVSKIDSIQSRLRMKTDGSVSILTIVGALESDGGNYSCAVQTEEETQHAYIFAASNIYVKTPGHVNVVEAEKLRIPCVVHGNPIPEITWIVHGNETYEESRGRVKLLPDPERKIPNSIFIIEDIQLSDRGVYTCKAYSNVTKESLTHDTMVRIKDKYAALWPFLGIVVEVLVLCIIILVYEKKRNKSEMEESDTDQSPEQKNTPDHDGKESNLRHRQ